MSPKHVTHVKLAQCLTPPYPCISDISLPNNSGSTARHQYYGNCIKMCCVPAVKLYRFSSQKHFRLEFPGLEANCCVLPYIWNSSSFSTWQGKGSHCHADPVGGDLSI